MCWKTITSPGQEDRHRAMETTQEKKNSYQQGNLSVRRYVAFLTFRHLRGQEDEIFKIKTEDDVKRG